MNTELQARINLLNKQLNEVQFEHLSFKSEFYIKYKQLLDENNELNQKFEKLKSFEKDNTTIKSNSPEYLELKDKRANLQHQKDSEQDYYEKVNKQLNELKREFEEINKTIKKKKVFKKELEITKRNIEEKKRLIKTNSAKLINEENKLKRIEESIKEKELIIDNIKRITKIIALFHQTIMSSKALSEIQKPKEADLPQKFQIEIIEAQKEFELALTRFDINKITDFLIPAQNAYEKVVNCLLEIIEKDINDEEDLSFEEKVFVLVKAGLPLQTNKLDSVKKMVDKINKGVEIAPLASFSNEVKEYYMKNLSLFKIIDNSK